MAAITNAPLVAIDEYIARFVDGGEKPTCEYVDGVLIPKPVGTKKHCQVQTNVAYLIRSRYEATLNPLTELTARLREGQFYVPDIAVEEIAKPIPGPLSRPERAGSPLHRSRLPRPIASANYLASARNTIAGECLVAG